MDTNQPTSGDLPVLFEKAHSLGKVFIFNEPGGAAFASVPDGRELVSIKKFADEYLERPERRTGIAQLQDLASFIDWTNRHKDAASVLRCHMDRDKPALHAVIDYHEEGAGELKGADGKARWAKFGAHYLMPLDQRWKDWSGVSGKALTQAAFAAFLEDHILDLISPNNSTDGDGNLVSNLPKDVARFLAVNGGKCGDPADVVQLSKGLDIYADTKVSERINLQSGETQFTFEEKHRGAPDSVVVPQIFLIAIPVFYLSDTVYRVPVRLRYRLDGGKLFWIPTLWQADLVFDKAVRDAAQQASSETELPLFYGLTL